VYAATRAFYEKRNDRLPPRGKGKEKPSPSI
jgi:hypothetical protein